MLRSIRLASLTVTLLAVGAFAYGEYSFHWSEQIDPEKPVSSLASAVRSSLDDWLSVALTAPSKGFKSDTPPQTAPALQLTLDARLFRTTLIGRPYGITSLADTIAKSSLTPLQTEFAAMAVEATSSPPCCQIKSSADYLSDRLREQTALAPVSAPPDIPAVNNDDMALLHVYAMVLGGHTEQAVVILKNAISSHSPFSQAVAVVALRALGTPAARAVLVAPPTLNSDIKALAEEAHGVTRPTLAEPKMYEGEMPYAIRERTAMLRQASNDANGTRTIMPTLLLGYVGEDAPPNVREQELQYLRSLPARYNDTIWYRHWYGTVSLALRSKETFAYWQQRLATEPAPYTQMAIVRIMAQAYPEEFARAAPEIVASPITGWSRSDALLMAATLAKGARPIGALDLIWFHPKRYRSMYPATTGVERIGDSDAIVRRFSQGNFAVDSQCPACTLSWFKSVRRKENDALYLLGIIRGRAAGQSYTAWANDFTDVRLLPALAALAASFPAESTRPREDIEYAERQLREGTQESGSGLCCADTDACLMSQVRARQAPDEQTLTIEQAIAYLEKLPPLPEIRIHDEEGQSKSRNVSVGLSAPARWTHWLGCWRPDES